MADAAIPEPDEVTLADIVRVLWRRRYVLLVLFLLCVGGAIGYTVIAKPQYKSTATIVAVEQQDVIQHWLESREAAIWVAQKVGDPLLSRIFPAQWDAGAQQWKAVPPTPERAGYEVAKLVTITIPPRTTGPTDRQIQVGVTFTDPGLARDLANAYVSSLEVIRPQLQNVTESALFEKFYQGSNEPDARRQAHQVALERQYWLVIDPAFAAVKASSPNVTLDVALGLVLGLLVGVLGAFAAEWVAAYRLSSRAPAVPTVAAEPGKAGSFRYRGK